MILLTKIFFISISLSLKRLMFPGSSIQIFFYWRECNPLFPDFIAAHHILMYTDCCVQSLHWTFLCAHFQEPSHRNSCTKFFIFFHVAILSILESSSSEYRLTYVSAVTGTFVDETAVQQLFRAAHVTTTPLSSTQLNASLRSLFFNSQTSYFYINFCIRYICLRLRFLTTGRKYLHSTDRESC